MNFAYTYEKLAQQREAELRDAARAAARMPELGRVVRAQRRAKRRRSHTTTLLQVVPRQRGVQ